MTVRSASPDDILLLAEFWYDQMALQSQKHSSIQLSPNAMQEWQAYAHHLADDRETLFLVAEINQEILGCIIAQPRENQVGLLPREIGVITDLILDLHSPHKRKNAVSELLKAVQDHFRQSKIQRIIVRVPTYSPVQQGFWRGLGLKYLEDTFWMDLNE